MSSPRHLDGYVWIAAVPERRQAGTSRRAATYEPRPRKITSERVSELRQKVATGRSLRSLAAEYGVSHETIRATLREREVVSVA